MGCLPKLCIFIKFNPRSTNQLVASSNLGHDIVTKDDDCVKKYTWEDICRITMNFSHMIGSGGFSTVYLGKVLPNLPFGAVKMIHAGSHHLKRVLKNELDILLRLRNENIVKLLGYYDDDDDDDDGDVHEGINALVLEYVPNGSLQENLESGSSLSWQRRMAIAFQLAKALEYLHEKCTPQIVHGDIKASNILLDEHLDCKLCDFGFAKMGFSSMVKPNSRPRGRQVMMGSPGYTDPHYLRTGLASKKNDVYSYGVIILELVTGMQAFCEERGQLLTSIMGPTLRDILQCEANKVAQMDMVDPNLAGTFDIKEARAMLSIAALCLHHSPLPRPSATRILQEITHNVPSISFLCSD